MSSKTIAAILTFILLAPIVLTINSNGINIQLAKATSSTPSQSPMNAAVTPTTIVIPPGGGLRILDEYYQPLATTVVNGSTCGMEK